MSYLDGERPAKKAPKVPKQISGGPVGSSSVLQQPILQYATTISKSESSVQVEIDSKGSKKYTVKVYDEDPEVAYNKAVELSKKLDTFIKEEK